MVTNDDYMAFRPRMVQTTVRICWHLLCDVAEKKLPASTVYIYIYIYIYIYMKKFRGTLYDIKLGMINMLFVEPPLFFLTYVH